MVKKKAAAKKKSVVKATKAKFVMSRADIQEKLCDLIGEIENVNTYDMSPDNVSEALAVIADDLRDLDNSVIERVDGSEDPFGGW